MRVVEIIADLHVADVDAAREFYASYLGLTTEEFNLGWVARFSSPDTGANVQVVTRDAAAPEDPVISIKVDDVDAAYQDAVRAAGLPMPEVRRAVDGRVLVEVDGAPVRVYRWVDVLDRDRGLDPGDIGRLLARIHGAVQPADEPMPGWYVDPVGAERWEALVSRLHDAGAPFAAELGALMPDILAAEELLEPVRATQLCHLDLWSDNVRRTPEGGLMVLDWENSGPGHPSRELGCAVFEFGLGEPDRVAALHRAYVVAGGPGRLTQPGDFTMLVAQLGHITEIGCERWLMSTTDAERRHNEAWVRESVDDPVTSATIESMLAAVSSPRRT